MCRLILLVILLGTNSLSASDKLNKFLINKDIFFGNDGAVSIADNLSYSVKTVGNFPWPSTQVKREGTGEGNRVVNLYSFKVQNFEDGGVAYFSESKKVSLLEKKEGLYYSSLIRLSKNQELESYGVCYFEVKSALKGIANCAFVTKDICEIDSSLKSKENIDLMEKLLRQNSNYTVIKYMFLNSGVPDYRLASRASSIKLIVRPNVLFNNPELGYHDSWLCDEFNQ